MSFAKWARVVVAVLGALVVAFRGHMVSEIRLHETALMVHSYELSREKGKRIGGGIHLYRSRGHADMSIILSVDQGVAHELGACLGRMAHDVLVCVDMECNASEYESQMPPLFFGARILVGENVSCGYGLETPLDVVGLAARAFHMESVHALRTSFGYPYLELVIPKSSISGIRAMFGALNRMEHRFVHGPMLYEARDATSFVSLPVLYTGFFLVLVPSIGWLCVRIDIVLVMVVALGYLNSWCSCVSLLYTLWRGSDAIESAMLPFLLHILAKALTDPVSIPENVAATVAFAILPPYALFLLPWQFGWFVLPVAFAFMGNWIRNLLTSKREAMMAR